MLGPTWSPRCSTDELNNMALPLGIRLRHHVVCRSYHHDFRRPNGAKLARDGDLLQTLTLATNSAFACGTPENVHQLGKLLSRHNGSPTMDRQDGQGG